MSQSLPIPTTLKSPIHRLPSALALALTTSLLLALASAASAQSFYETTLVLQQPLANVTSTERVVYRWSTPFPNGLITELDLDDLTLYLYGPDGQIYVDPIIVNGVVQPIDGLPRALGSDNDVFWRFDLDTGTLEQMTNVNQDLIEMTSGRHFDVHDSISIPDDGRVSIKSYIDGINQDPHTDQLDVQFTSQLLFFDDFETGDTSGWSQTQP